MASKEDDHMKSEKNNSNGSKIGNNREAPVYEEKHMNDEIEKLLINSKKKDQNKVKLLILGAGESGKSTVLKQLKILHKGDFSIQEKIQYKNVIWTETINSMQKLIMQARKLGIPLDCDKPNNYELNLCKRDVLSYKEVNSDDEDESAGIEFLKTYLKKYSENGVDDKNDQSTDKTDDGWNVNAEDNEVNTATTNFNSETNEIKNPTNFEDVSTVIRNMMIDNSLNIGGEDEEYEDDIEGEGDGNVNVDGVIEGEGDDHHDDVVVDDHGDGDYDYDGDGDGDGDVDYDGDGDGDGDIEDEDSTVDTDLTEFSDGKTTKKSGGFNETGEKSKPAPNSRQAIAASVKKLWESDSGIQECYNRRNLFQLEENCKYFFEKFDIFSEDDYVCDYQDILKGRIKTTGITETKFDISNICFNILDAGGQRSERHKWIHCFHDITAVMFVFAVSEYDQVLFEDEKVNRMQEALLIFDSLCNSRWFANTPFILFLNKIDILEEKVRKQPIRKFFPDFRGRTNNAEDAIKYFESNCLMLNRTKKPIYVHRTCATDTKSMKFVLSAVTDMIIQNNLKRSGLI